MHQSFRGRLPANGRPFLTTLFVTTFLFTMVVIANGVGEDFSIVEKALEKIVKIHPDKSLKQNISSVASQMRLPFCIEGSSDVEALLDRRDLFNTDQTNAASFITRLETLGFSVQKYANGMLLRSPEVVRIANNPLDNTVQKFHFEGQYKDLIRKICDLFPGLPPNLVVFDGMFPSEIVCRIDVNKSISLRDLLILSAEQSSVMWQAVILSNAPTYVIEDGTGKRQETRGSCITLSFPWRL
jgi:hypothetical protein